MAIVLCDVPRYNGRKSLTVRVEELRSKDNYVKLEQISSISRTSNRK
ncbi:MAG: hypothetical protein ACLRQF_11725 [Thomasclavelia ramosa]